MNFLVLDRSTRQPSLAVFEDSLLAFEHVWLGEPTRAPEWIADVEQMLSERSIRFDSLEGFVCGLGPGSFSGIRACLSALSGLALPNGDPVFGVASAAALALGQAQAAERITVVGDARRNRLWCVTYQVDPGSGRVRLRDGKAPSHTAADFLLVPAAALAEAVPDGTRIVTSDWERLEPVLQASFDTDRLVPQAVFPKASDLGTLALRDAPYRVLEPMPIYLHPAVAVPEASASHT